MADTDSPNPPKSAAPPPIRTLVINMVFTMFVSVVVFAIASYAFLVPHMFDQKRQLEAMKEEVRRLDERARIAEAAAEEATQADTEEEEATEVAQAAADGAEPTEQAPADEPVEGTGIAAATE